MEPTSGNWIAADDVNRLVREIDVALNGAEAAPQAALCDIAGQLATLSRTHGPLLSLLQQCLNPIFVVNEARLDPKAMAEMLDLPCTLVSSEDHARLTGIDYPHFKAVAWFDTFNAHVYYDRVEAQRAHDSGNVVLPIESFGKIADPIDQVLVDALTGTRGIGAMRVNGDGYVERFANHAPRALTAGGDGGELVPSARKWSVDNSCAVTAEWMAGWDACRVEYPSRARPSPVAADAEALAREVIALADERELGYRNRVHGGVVNHRIADKLVVLANRLKGSTDHG